MVPEGATVTDLPLITPTFATQPKGVAWPTAQWPRATSGVPVGLERVVDAAFSSPELATTHAVVIVHGGRVLVERYGGARAFFDRPAEPIDAATPLLSWSMAKSMLHMIVGTLVDEHRLDPDRPAPVPEWSDPADPRREIRVRDLLAMRDGLDFHEAYEFNDTSDVIAMLYGDGQDDMAGYTARRPPAHRPDTVFNYSSGTTNILSRVVADLVGRGDDYRAYLKDRLFAPIGMASAEPTLDPSGVWVASSYVHACALDFAKFGLLYLRGGEWDGRQLVSREWASTAQVPLSRDEESGHLYSWQWWLDGDAYGTYWASGYAGQRIEVVPTLDAVIVRFGETTEEKYPALDRWHHDVIDCLARGR